MSNPATTSAAPAPTGATAFGHRPALDGLRGLALLAIVAFHSQIPGVGGAFLSVSTFFTLSGFLITIVALGAYERAGHVGIRDFYVRRIRRLLPAALIAIAGITLVTALWGNSTQQAPLRGDALASLFYVANWRLVVQGESYGAIFDSPSLFTHFWTLAIEEQFYVLFPLALAAVLRVGRGSWRVLAGVIGAGIVGLTAWSALLSVRGASVDRLYFGTDARIPEILIGCLAALLWSRLGGHTWSPRAERRIARVGAVALVVMLWSWHSAERTNGLFYRGGLAVYALVTVTVILASLQSTGPVTKVLSWRPLMFVGTISYAAYLIHWPVLVLLQQHTPLTPWPRLAVGGTITLALAVVSLRVIERPVRSGRWPSPRRLAPVAVGAMAAVAVLVVATAARLPEGARPVDYEEAARRLSSGGPVGSGSPSPPGSVDLGNLTPEQARWFDEQARLAAATSPRVALFGDSTATMTGLGLATWTGANLDELSPGKGETSLGCGLLADATLRTEEGEGRPRVECTGWRDRWVAAARANDKGLGIAVVQLGPWDVRDTRLTPDGRWMVVGRDRELDDALRSALDDGVKALLPEVGMVALVLPPDISLGRVDGQDPPRVDPASDPARMEAFRSIVREVAAANERTAVVDLAGYLRARGDDDRRLRPDGIHFTEETSLEVADWLGPELVRSYRSTVG